MILTYTFSDIGKNNNLKTREEAIKSCDEGAKAMVDMIKIVGESTGGGKAMIWLLSHCYRRKLTDDYIEYDFYLLRWLTKLAKKK